MKTKNKMLMIIMLLGFAFAMSSCATSEPCWAYRDTKKYNNHKHRPSVAGAMNKHNAKLRY